MRNNCKREGGMVTVEAIISLSAFMFAMFTILSVVNVCVIQAKMAAAINATAKELSQYSYLYALTGFNESTAKLSKASEEQEKQLDSVLNNIYTVFGEIQNLKPDPDKIINSEDPVSSISDEWDRVAGSVENIEKAGSDLKNTIAEMAKDPKKLIFGIAKMVTSEGLEIAKSRLIAAPLASVLCQKHLVDTDGGDTNAYLKGLGVVPRNGSYVDGLDFTQSTLFPYGSNEITVSVSYDVKVIALLPIHFAFHFEQKAITHGWLAGEATYQSVEKKVMEKNESLWNSAAWGEIKGFIRKQALSEMKAEGYMSVSDMTDVELYNAEKNEFVKIESMNPLYTPEGEKNALTLNDLNDEVLKEAIEEMCGAIKSSTERKKQIKTKIESDSGTTYGNYDCEGASNKIILVIPEDDGLKERIESIIAKANTRGVTIEVTPSYGKGASESEADNAKNGGDVEG